MAVPTPAGGEANPPPDSLPRRRQATSVLNLYICTLVQLNPSLHLRGGDVFYITLIIFIKLYGYYLCRIGICIRLVGGRGEYVAMG